MFPKTTQFEKLLEAVPDALVGVDQKGVIRFVNRQTEHLFGYDRDQLIGEHIDTLVPEPLWEVYAEHRQDYFTDPRTRSLGLDLELSGRHQDGTDLPINITMSLIDTGDVLLVIAGAGDVTRQKKAVAKAELLDAIVEYSDDAIMGLTLGGIVTSWNPAAERMYGYSSMEMIGRSGSLLTPQDRAGELNAILDRIKDGRYVEHAETTLVRKDGTAVPVSIAAAPIRSEDGTVVGASCVHRDVTTQRQAFEAAQRMASIVENSDEAIISSTLDGVVTSWNPAAARMFDYSSAEIVGKPATLLIPKDRASDSRDIAGQVRAGQPVRGLETKRVRKNGSVFPVALSASPVRGADGTVVGASVIYHDLSKQKGALATAQRIAAIVESSKDAIIARTLDGTITSWNPAAARMFGYSSAEIVGQHVGLLIPQDRGAEMISVLAKISAGQPVDDFETVRVRKDGTVFPVALTISPLHNEHGAVTGASVIYRDLSKLRHAAWYARSLIEAALDPMVTISPDGTIMDTNEAALKATGVARHKLIGTDFSGYFTDAQQAHECYQRAFAQGSVTNYPLTLRRRDGARTDVLYNASVYRDEGGAVLGVCAVARDLTRHEGPPPDGRPVGETPPGIADDTLGP